MNEQPDWLAPFDPFASEGDFTINFTDAIFGLLDNAAPVQRCEQYVLDGSPDTYHFFVKQFFEPMFQKAQA